MIQSIRVKLTILFLATIVIPVVVIVLELPSYYTKLIKEQESSLLEGTLTALTFSIETYLDDLERLTITPYLSEPVMDTLRLKSTFQWQLISPYAQYTADQELYVTLPNLQRNTRKDILGTILLPLYDSEPFIISSSGYSNRAAEGYAFDKQDWYIKALKADGDVAFISVHRQNYLEGANAEVFSVARLIKDPDSQRPLAVIMADADSAALERMMSGIRLNKGSIAAILDDKRKLIYASRAISADMQRELAEEKTSVHGEHEHYSVVRQKVSRSDWEIVVLSPETVIQSKLTIIYRIGLGIGAGGVMIALILYFTVSHWIVNPFKRMVAVMKRVQRGDMHTFYEVRGSDEISQLGIQLNKMISRLDELIDREYKAVLGQRNAEYRALQSQVQPHFLYNTLNGFIGLNRSGQSELLERAIFSLSGMLRYTLEHNDWAQLGEEIEFLAKYCELQQMRFSERIKVHIDCDPAASLILIPKLLLQPIVENAIIHGIEPCDRDCELHIEAVLQGDETRRALFITIADNGTGFEPGTEREDVGIRNVRERIRLAFEGGEVTLESVPDHGTTVRIQIPLKDVNPV